MAPNYGITITNDEDGTLPPSTSTDESVQKTVKFVDATKEQLSISIPHPSEYSHDLNQGSQVAILRSLRAAGVKFIRFTTVDAYNTIRCKTVPLAQLISQGRTNPASSPLSNPVSIAEICFAGLPSSADVPAAPNLSARNVLTLQPDFSSLRILPYASKTAMVMCTAHNQQSGDLSPLCSRGLLQRVLHSAKEDLGIEFSVGAELEFQLYRENKDGVMQSIDMSTFANTTTLNEQEDFISTLYDQLEQQDIPVELIHSESAPGQLEVVLSYSDDILQLADDVVYARETVRNVAKQHGMKAVFLPKTSMMTAGNGGHLHFSFTGSKHRNAFSDPSQPTGISRKGGAFIEGLLDHLPSLLSLSIPTVNSFRRVGPGCWTGHKVGWSTEDKESPVRVCIDLNTQQATNVELKLSDATANIYLELTAILSAGMEGIKNEKVLRPMMDDEDSALPLPQSLQESLDLLKKDELLLSILGDDLSTAYIAVRELEVSADTTLEDEVSAALKA